MLPSENPWPIIIVCLFGMVGLLIAWYQLRHKWLLGVMLLPLLGCLGAWEYDRIVVTDREKVVENVRGIVGAFQRRDLETMLSYISNSATDLKLLAAAAYNLVELGADTRLTDLRVEMPRNGRAISVFRVNSTLQSAQGAYRVATMWEARWQPEEDDWKMIDIVQRDPVTGKPEHFPREWRQTLRSMYPQTN